MDKINNLMLNQKIGKRFKELIKEYDGTQEVTSMATNYAKGSISRFCSGKETLPDEIIANCVRRWKIREEYIRCIDDFKTDSEFLNYAEMQNKEDFLHQKNYLETLGFTIKLTYSVFCSKNAIYQHKEALIPFLRDDSIEMLENDSDFSLEPKEFYCKNSNSKSLLFLKRPLTDEIASAIGSIHKQSTIVNDIDTPFDLDRFFIPSNESILGENTLFSVYFRTYYQGKYVGDFSIAEIQKVFKIIDSFTRCSIETFLVNDYKLYNEYNDI